MKTLSKLAYSYRRYSSTNQTDGSSLERQLEMAQAVCSEKGWTLVDLPPDQGISGFKGLNKIKGALGTFLKRVKQGEITKGSVLIIEKLDRFSRDEVDIVAQDFLSLLQAGIEIYSCVDNTHYTLADIRKNAMLLTHAVMGIFYSNDYSKSMGGRISKSFSIRLANCAKGEKYNLGGWVPKWFDFIGEEKKPGKYEPNSHFPIVQKICQDYIDGNSMYKIARGLIKDNTPTLMGGKWAQGTIANLLRHSTLQGTLNLKGLTIPNFYPPVLNKAQWDKLQAKLNENRNRKGGDGASDYIANLFRNRCKCAHCGETITTAKSSSQRLYVCKGKRLGKCASKYSVKVSEVELDFFLLYLQKHPDELLSTNSDKQTAIVNKMLADIAQYDKAIKDATELIGVLPIEELKTKITDLENKRQTAKGIVDRINTNRLSSQTAPKVLGEVKEIVSRLLKGKETPKSNQDFIRLANDFQKRLSDNETRKRLLNLLPTLVKTIIVDTTKGAYAVVNHSGKQSEWRQVIEV
jgi:hypothetical protein